MDEKEARVDARPNMVLILADDLGFSDIGCYGSEIETPNIDRLAYNGVRFTQMYNCARCCPSRASLLTGLYPHQAGIGHMTQGVKKRIPSYQGYLRDDCVTIAEALKAGGYNTGMVGKWHVGGWYDIQHPETWRPGTPGYPTPTQRGFDKFYGILEGASSYYNPHTLMDDDNFIMVSADEEYYFTDAISEKAVEMIRDFHQQGTPFFLYIAYTAPHWPLHALPEDIEKYRGKYLKGWDEVRNERYERLIEMGIIDRRWRLSPRNLDAPPWEKAKYKAWEDARMATYAAQIDRMDQGIGKIMAELGKLGLEKNTLVIFLSDNGGCAELLKENGWVERFVLPTRKGEPVRVGNDPEIMPGPEDTYMSYGLNWANVSNTPFLLFKHWVHEGGISTPAVFYWPARVKEPGRLAHEPVHFIDVMATCLDAAGLSYPKEFNGRTITPLEGESLVPILHGENWKREKPLFWEHEGNRAVRWGEWKLVRLYPGRWELYNIQEDRTELNDLAGRNPKKVKELEALYDEWADRCGVLSWEEVMWLLP